MIKTITQRIHTALLLISLILFGGQQAAASSEAAYFPFSVDGQNPIQTFHFTAPYPGTVIVNSIWTAKAELELELLSDGAVLEKISGPAPLQITYPANIALEYEIRIGGSSLQSKVEGGVAILVMPTMPKTGSEPPPPQPPPEPPPPPPPPLPPDPVEIGLLPPIPKIIEITKTGRPSPKVKIPPKEKVTIVIKDPANKDQIAYAGNLLLIPLMAKVTPTKYANQVKWYIDKNGNTTLDKSGKVAASHNPSGAADYFEFTTYPENNSDFGEKTIMAEIPGLAVAAPVKIEVFFDPKDTSHPPGKGEKTKTPNWFYYWGQTTAGKGFSPVFLEKHPCGWSATGTYWFNQDYISLYPETYGSVCMNRTNNSTAKGIDCYAETLRHENVHREELQYWWKNIPNFTGIDAGTVSDAESTLLSYLSFIGPVECDEWLGKVIVKAQYNWLLSVDSDGDLVPDYIEEGLAGCDPKKTVSCPKIPLQVIVKAQQIGKTKLDVDMNSYRISWNKWPITKGMNVQRSSGKADKEDWSYCGNQWKDRTPCKFK